MVIGAAIREESLTQTGAGLRSPDISRGIGRPWGRWGGPAVVPLLLAGLSLLAVALRLYAAHLANQHLPDTPARLVGDEKGYDDLAYGLLRGSFFEQPYRTLVRSSRWHSCTDTCCRMSPGPPGLLVNLVLPLHVLVRTRGHLDSVRLDGAACAGSATELVGSKREPREQPELSKSRGPEASPSGARPG